METVGQSIGFAFELNEAKDERKPKGGKKAK
jgi:hypothetical protein